MFLLLLKGIRDNSLGSVWVFFAEFGWIDVSLMSMMSTACVLYPGAPVASLIPTFRADKFFTVARYKVEASDTPDAGNIQVCIHHAGGKFDLTFSAPVRISVGFPAKDE
jgi:hypothetical protein